MNMMASQITSLTIVYWTVYSGADQTKKQSSASLAFVWGAVTGEFPAQRVSNAENVPIWWRHYDLIRSANTIVLIELGHTFWFMTDKMNRVASLKMSGCP